MSQQACFYMHRNEVEPEQFILFLFQLVSEAIIGDMPRHSTALEAKAKRPKHPKKNTWAIQ